MPPTAASVSLICGFDLFRCKELLSAYPFELECECSWCESSCMACMATYKNVPAENNNSIPVHHWPLSPSICCPPPRILTNNQVVNAPNGAAKLKIIRCPRAARLLSPCFRSTEVNPNAAGALWIMMAMKIMNPSLVLELVAEAPMAIPSAAAWITRPVVVARERVCFGVGVSDWRKDSDSSSSEEVVVEWSP